jgi:hypothetical protein
MRRNPAIKLTAVDPTGKPIPVFLPQDETAPESLGNLTEPNQLVTLCTYLAKSVPVYLKLNLDRIDELDAEDREDAEYEAKRLAERIRSWGYRVEEII